MTTTNLLINNKFNLNSLMELSRKPPVFTPGVELFWNDEHISKGMLEAHLNSQWDAASFNHSKIDDTTDFLIGYLNLNSQSKVLDLGCGPGLYCSRFYKSGANVTGIDLSKRSIDYAVKTAAEEKQAITYIYGDYLKIHYPDTYDSIFMIYYDLGVLSNECRDLLLQKVYKALTPRGHFVFDITTKTKHAERSEKSNWYVCKEGFWMASSHLALEQTFHYPEHNTYLDQYIIVDEEGNARIYRTYDHYYDVDTISAVLESHGFEVVEIYEDLSGKPYSESSETMGIVARKV